LWLWFQQLSLLAPLANLLAIPCIGFLVVPPLLLAILCLPFLPAVAEVIFQLLSYPLEWLWWVLEGMAALPGSTWQTGGLGIAWLYLMGFALVCLMAPAALPLRAAGVGLLIPMFWLAPERPATGGVWLTLLDVGQGLAAVTETRNHALVYDTGPAFSTGLDTGELVVVPFLRQRGYRRVDHLVISHSDMDHQGGGRSIFQQIEVRKISSGEPQAIHWARASRCQAGRHWQLDQVKFDFLAPFSASQGNNASCVLRIETTDGLVILLPGDIEREVERQLTAAKNPQLRADILVAPHHGSKTSSSPEFIDAVEPVWVLFATGYRNRFGFPRQAIVERYRRRGVIALDTADSGSILFRADPGKPVEPVRYRHQRRGYWGSGP